MTRLRRSCVSALIVIAAAGCSDSPSQTDQSKGPGGEPASTGLPPARGPEQMDSGPVLYEVENPDHSLILPPSDYAVGAEALSRSVAVVRDLIDGTRVQHAEKATEATEFVDRVLGMGPDAGQMDVMLTRRPRLHLVGHYEGNDEHDDRAVVRVTDTSSPVVLCVCAHDAVDWEIKVAEGVRLERIIVAGSHLQTVSHVPRGTEVTGWCQGPGRISVTDNLAGYSDLDFRFSAYRGISSWVACDQYLRKLTSHRVCTRMGSYSAGDSPVIVGPENREWLIQMQVHALKKLCAQAVRYRAVKHFEPVLHSEFQHLTRDSTGKSVLGTGTVFGPWFASLQPVQGGIHRIAHDPEFGTLTLHDYALARVDSDSGELTPLPVTGLEELHGDWPLAVDTERNLLFAWGYKLSRIDLKNGELQTLTEGNSGSIQSMVWWPERSCLLGVAYSERVRGAIGTIYEVNERGAAVRKVQLDFPVPCTGRPQLRMLHGSLLLFTNERSAPPYWYVIDPTSGRVQFRIRGKASKRRPAAGAKTADAVRQGTSRTLSM